MGDIRGGGEGLAVFGKSDAVDGFFGWVRKYLHALVGLVITYPF